MDRALELPVSNIPSTAVSQALTPLARATHEALRARQVQSQKNFHHSEDVEALDDTAVNSVRKDSRNRQGQGGNDQPPKDGEPEEKLDLQSLPTLPPPPPADSREPGAATPHLDISA